MTSPTAVAWSLSPSKFQVPHLHNGDNKISFTRLLRVLNEVMTMKMSFLQLGLSKCQANVKLVNRALTSSTPTVTCPRLDSCTWTNKISTTLSAHGHRVLLVTSCNLWYQMGSFLLSLFIRWYFRQALLWAEIPRWKNDNYKEIKV